MDFPHLWPIFMFSCEYVGDRRGMGTNLCLFVTIEVRVLGKPVEVDKNVILQLLIGCSFQPSGVE